MSSTSECHRDQTDCEEFSAQWQLVLAGNPNSGKTTLFNLLTGLRYKVANYPGVTVEKKTGHLTMEGGTVVQVVDLPGIYSLSGQSEDEVIAERELRSLPADRTVIVAVVDSSNLERNLFLLTELLDLQIPLVAVLNMSDIAARDGAVIHEALLERKLGVPIVRLTATKGKGEKALITAVTGVMKRVSCNSKSLHPPFLASGSISDRYQEIHKLVKSTVTYSFERQWRSDLLDRWLLHPVWGLVIFFAVMAFLFQSIFSWASYPADWIDTGFAALGNFVQELLPDSMIRSLLVNGVIAGVGSVLVFVPQIAILFFLLGILEDSGYLCRAAFLMDRVMRGVGLQGRSFIPLLSSFSCAVPGIMATRTIPSRGDRLLTILIAPLMSCSARLPIYSVLIGAFIPPLSIFGPFTLQGLMLCALYLLGIVVAGGVAFIFRKLLFRRDPTIFLMEMPRYKIPSLRSLLRQVWDRVEIFIKNAGTIILSCSVVLWFLASYPKPIAEETLTAGTDTSSQVEQSYAGHIGRAIEPLIRPLGYNWEIGVSLLASFAAREVFVSSLSTIYHLQNEDSGTQSLMDALRARSRNGEGFGLPTALSLLVFYALACQCISTLAVCRRETGSWRWPACMFLYMTVLAYVAAWATYQIAAHVLT